MPYLDAYSLELTRGEKLTAALMAKGLKNVEIARELGISPRAITARLQHIYFKISGLDGLELPEESWGSTEIRAKAVDFFKAHPKLYEDLPN